MECRRPQPSGQPRVVTTVNGNQAENPVAKISSMRFLPSVFWPNNGNSWILASLSSTQQKWGRLDMMEFVELTRLIHTYTELRARDNNNKVAFVTRSPNLSCFSYLFWLESWLTLIVLYHFELANKPRIDFVSHGCFFAFCIKLAT